MEEQLMMLNSINHKLDKMSRYIIQSKESKEMVNKILSSIVNHVFKLYKKTGMLDYYEEIAPELELFWKDFSSVVGNTFKFDEKEEPFLITYGEIPYFALKILYNVAEKAGRKELSSKLESAIWAIENEIFNHKDSESLEKFYKCSTKMI